MVLIIYYKVQGTAVSRNLFFFLVVNKEFLFFQLLILKVIRKMWVDK